MQRDKCLCIENFKYFFPTEIENLVFLVHDDHIFFVLAGEKGIEISVCFEALDANFWWPLREVIPIWEGLAMNESIY